MQLRHRVEQVGNAPCAIPDRSGRYFRRADTIIVPFERIVYMRDVCSPVTNVETDASFARYGNGLHYPFDFGRSRDHADTDDVLEDITAHEPVLRLSQVLRAVGGLEGIETIRCSSDQRGSVCAALRKMEERAFDMPTQ